MRILVILTKMHEIPLIFYLLLLLVAILYSSVGHGGASGYLALMALFGMAPSFMKPAALVLNIFVSFIAFIPFYRAGFFRFRMFIPFILTSIPAAFAGGMITIDAQYYKPVLGILLLFPILNLLGVFKLKSETDSHSFKVIPALAIGLLIGFVSGLIGIGGGILLSPVLLLLRWTNMKETAALSAPFILVNSLAGLGGQLSSGITLESNLLPLVLCVLAGGFAGSYMGALKAQASMLRKILAMVLMIASLKLIFV